MSTYHIENFGCRATQADGAALAQQFEARGVEAASAGEAELVLLNTCTVTAAADQDARAAIRRVHRQNPLAKIIVTGCYAQRAPAEIAALPGVTSVVGNSHKHQLPDIVLGQSLRREGNFLPLSILSEKREDRIEDSIFVSDIFAHTELLAAAVFESGGQSKGRTRPNLKVQDGCDNRCSFCVIPSVRGHSRSLPLTRVVEDMKALIAAGYREVVISGINLGRWGRDFERCGGKSTFEDLLRSILAETAIEKLRISSVEPMDWSDELIDLMASSSRIAKHAHVPLQSASDEVLRRMHRKYRPWHYREKIEKIRAAMPNAAIGADVMTGFPGETDTEFESTRRFIEALPFTYLHVFTYSARPGTPAAAMQQQVPVQVARERNKILRELGERKKLDFMRGFVGHAVPAIALGAAHEAAETTEALTDNYLKLNLRGRQEPNQWIQVCVDGVSDQVLTGHVVSTIRTKAFKATY